MFHASILQIQEELNYHKTQQEKLEQELYILKSYEEFAGEAFDNVRDTIEQIEDPKCLELFKESLLSLFPEQPIYLEEKVKEDLDDIKYTDDSDPDYKSIEQLQDEDPDNIAVFHSEEHLESKGITPVTKEVKKEFGPLSYYELTGKPDTRPDTYEDLAPNITYSSSGRAYVGFHDREEAEEFRDSISEPSMLSDTDTMNGYKYEVKFYCNREYIEELQQELENDWTPEQKAELDWQEQLIRTANDIFYDPSNSKCYVGFSAKGRADQYGSYLSRILDIAEKYIVTNKPLVTTNTKYELVLEQIELDSAQHLSKFNLKKEYDDSKNKDARELWRTTRQRKHEPACKPLPKLVPLNEVRLGDIVYLNSITNQYKVLSKVELDGIPHLEVICTYNSERPSLVGATSYLKECYKVPADSVQIDSQFQEEETITKTVELKPTVKKSSQLTTEDFIAPPYQKISLDEIEVCDIVSTGSHVQAFYEIYQHNGTHVLGRCLYHNSLKMRIGQDGFYITTPFLVEKATEKVVAA